MAHVSVQSDIKVIGILLSDTNDTDICVVNHTVVNAL